MRARRPVVSCVCAIAHADRERRAARAPPAPHTATHGDTSGQGPRAAAHAPPPDPPAPRSSHPLPSLPLLHSTLLTSALLHPTTALSAQRTMDEHMRMRLDTSQAALNVARSVMYSDAGFDVSRCGRFLALCELDPLVGYHLRTFSLQKRTMGQPLQTVALPNCPFVTSVQFAPLSHAVLIGYGRCQAPPLESGPQYAVLRCVEFQPRAGNRRELTEELTLSPQPSALSPRPSPSPSPSLLTSHLSPLTLTSPSPSPPFTLTLTPTGGS